MQQDHPIPADSKVSAHSPGGEPSAPEASTAGWVRLRTIRAFAVVVATLIGLYVCYLLALPFLAALTWALTVAVLGASLHRHVERVLRRPSLAAGVSVGVLATIIFLPLALLMQQLVGELGTGVTAVQKQFSNGDLLRSLASVPVLGWLVGILEGQFDFRSIFNNLTSWLTGLGGLMVTGSLSSVITILLTF